MWFKRHWRALVGALPFVPALFKGAKGLVGLGGDADFIISRSQDPAWLRDVLNWLTDPPGWSILPLIVLGLGLIFWDAKRNRRPADDDVATADSLRLPGIGGRGGDAKRTGDGPGVVTGGDGGRGGRGGLGGAGGDAEAQGSGSVMVTGGRGGDAGREPGDGGDGGSAPPFPEVRDLRNDPEQALFTARRLYESFPHTVAQDNPALAGDTEHADAWVNEILVRLGCPWKVERSGNDVRIVPRSIQF